MTTITNSLEKRFLTLTVSDLNSLYYDVTTDDNPRFSHDVSEALGFNQKLQFPLQKFTAPTEYAEEFKRLIVKYGNMLHRHGKSGGSWRDFETVADLVRKGNH
jgi:hypothetical protein